ncbi:hypothetical protein LAZ67_7003146 [Cordylochernes scorpioides]|uniref:EGF-like domain-containing protein n=1 Tax=Cordylochernes scorpioides TaxID=51811 RepID=A0ABY6KNM3_9ARAC|nr:hypothetical protein LAZ67_7003146 [Cordylochernes scorpioides]
MCVLDVNECEEAGICSQMCFNSKGSYKCSCHDGYKLSKNVHTCKALNWTSAFLVISNRRSILVANLNTTSLERVPVRVENVVATASDMATGTLYWSDMMLKKILKLRKGATEPDVVVSSGLDLVEGLGVDWVAQNIYWVDSRLKTIAVSTIEGRHQIVLLSDNISQPRGLVLDPREGARVLFWTDWGENPRIESVGLDGSMRRTIIDSKIYWPNGLTLDIPNRRVYFADSKLDYIDFCNYDGSGRQQVLSHNHLSGTDALLQKKNLVLEKTWKDKLQDDTALYFSFEYLLHPHSLTLFEDTLYWTDRQLNRVLSCHKYYGGKNQSVVSHLVSQPLGIHVHHPVLQPPSPNPCAGAPCSHLCLLSPAKTTGYACRCPFGTAHDKSHANSRCVPVDQPYLMVVRGSQLVDLSLTPGDKTRHGYFTPVIGIDNAHDFQYDKDQSHLYWVQLNDDDKENKIRKDKIQDDTAIYLRQE